MSSIDSRSSILSSALDGRASLEDIANEILVQERALAAFREEVTLIEGEAVIEKASRVHDVTHSPARPPLGKVLLTNYQIMFIPYDRTTYTGFAHGSRSVPLGCVVTVEAIDAGLLGRGPCVLTVATKDGRTFRFTASSSVCRSLAAKTAALAFSGTPFALLRIPPMPAPPSAATSPVADPGWLLYDAEREWARMGVPNAYWRLCTANASYSLCSTYPRLLVVPASVSDDAVRASAGYRSRGRFPVLSYTRHGASIVRAAQPQRGLLDRVCAGDEEMVAAAKGEAGALVIADARPQVAAFGNAVLGAGYEHGGRYQVPVEFLRIDNIHAVRDAYRKLCELCAAAPSDDGDAHYWSAVDGTRWLEHVLRVLQGAVRIAGLVESGQSVLVHCSDGWDRTSQLVSLAMLLLDEHYRTLHGFAVLVEKEWVAAGHQFRQRCGHGQRVFWSGHTAPVFLLWLQCVRELQRHFPTAFEFSEALLVFLAEHVYSCRFATFLFDCERELESSGARQHGASVWSYVLAHRAAFVSPAYTPTVGLMRVQMTMRHITVWCAARVEDRGRAGLGAPFLCGRCMQPAPNVLPESLMVGAGAGNRDAVFNRAVIDTPAVRAAAVHCSSAAVSSPPMAIAAGAAAAAVTAAGSVAGSPGCMPYLGAASGTATSEPSSPSLSSASASLASMPPPPPPLQLPAATGTGPLPVPIVADAAAAADATPPTTAALDGADTLTGGTETETE